MSNLDDFLCKTPFFGGLTPAQLARLSSKLRVRECKQGETIFLQGDQGRSMYVVELGELVARQARAGGTVKLHRFRRGDFFGETTLIEMQPRPWTAVAEFPSRLLELTNVDLYQLYREDVAAYVLVLQNINRELCRRLRSAGDRITEIASEEEEEVTQIGVKPVKGPERA